MSAKKLRQLIGILLVMTIFMIMNFGLVYPQDLATGKWDCSGDGINGETVQYTLDLKQSGEEVTGSVIYGSDAVDISKGSIAGNKLEFVVTTDDNHYVSVGIIENGRIVGTWKDDNGTTGKWEGQKQVAK